MERLISAILLMAIKDWEDEKYKSDVNEFIESTWFSDLTEGLKLNPQKIKKALVTNSYIKKQVYSIYR